ncbi:unnamed protein product [Protopolystoma xenopodis]|uniref:Uncharacterized protein n=1 Tax=Protopolystoma xenopodis TaxID=117903 RepID=A0A448WU47_9PLAT|nr:unnamed protein product [Protopolystoma xenopodis]
MYINTTNLNSLLAQSPNADSPGLLSASHVVPPPPPQFPPSGLSRPGFIASSGQSSRTGMLFNQACNAGMASQQTLIAGQQQQQLSCYLGTGRPVAMLKQAQQQQIQQAAPSFYETLDNMMAEFEEMAREEAKDPNHAARVRAAVNEVSLGVR